MLSHIDKVELRQDYLEIVVIDDDASIQRLISEQFKCWNYVVKTFSSGPSAYEYIQEHPVDVITLDYNMPKADGLEIFSRIKKINSVIPVVMLTNYGNIPLVEKFMRMGGAGFVEKPFELEVLDAKVRQIISGWLLKISEKEQKELAQSLHTVTVLFGAGAHELRTALTVIEQRTRFLLHGVISPGSQPGITTPSSACPNPLPGQVPHLEIAYRNVQRLLDLVADLLDFARIESGVSLSMTELDFNDLLKETLHEVAGLLDEKPEVKLVTELATRLPIIQGNRKRMIQIVTNLLSNAMKFTEKGTVSVETRLRTNGWVELTVSDTGIGISPEKQPQIFSEFTESTASHLMSGSGLGLSIAQMLTKKMGGELNFKSQQGKGTVFYLIFPPIKEDQTNG